MNAELTELVFILDRRVQWVDWRATQSVDLTG